MSDNKSPNSESKPVTNAEFKAALMIDGARFECYGHKFKVRKTEFTSSHDVDPLYAIGRDEVFGGSMNVNKFGPTCVTVYSYDMLGNKTTGKFPYKLIMLVD